MSAIDVTDLLQEISPESPCGEDLEYDARFGELERAAEGKPERQIGDSIQPAEEPDWKAVRGLSLELLRRTKDLRVAVHLCLALTRSDGFPGLRQGLELLNGLIGRYWEPVHPQLDPDDGYDPTFRLNVLAALASPEGLVRGVRECALVSSRGLGQYSLRDWEVAQGHQPPPADMPEPPTPSVIEAAFMDAPMEDVQATSEAVHGALEALGSLNGQLEERVGADTAPDFSPLKALLQEAGQIAGDFLARRGGATSPPQETEAMTDSGAPTEAPSAPGSGMPGVLNSRQDVLRALDAVCDYYQRHEPSSPIPLLMKRAKRLVDLDFMAIIRDLAPNAVQQVEDIRGPDEG